MQAASQGEKQTHHLLFDLLQVLIRQGLHVKVIIEAIVYPGAYSHLGVGEQLLDSHGHHMGTLKQQLYGRNQQTQWFSTEMEWYGIDQS
jgi:hypothetical protein